MLEGDLAFQGVDLRDLYRPGSGLTPRRLWVLIWALPRPTAFSSGARFWSVLEAEKEADIKPTQDRIREREQHYTKGGT